MSILAMRRTEHIEFGAFMKNEYKDSRKGLKPLKTENKAMFKKVTKAAVTIPVVGHLISKGSMAMASDGSVVTQVPAKAIPAMSSGEVMEKIAHAFDPLIDLMVGISLPIAGVMLTGGALMIMIGQKDMGFRLIMNSALGYVLVQMTPLFIDLLAGVGAAI